MIDLNSTAELLGAFGVLDRPKTVLLDLFFPRVQTFDTQEVYFDKVQRARRLAPFVVPTVAGHPMRSRGYATQGFRPAYVKPKHSIEPMKAMTRRPGEQILGSMSPRDRFEAAMLDNMQQEDDSIARREEWMATQLMLTGAMTAVSPEHPPVVVDLQRNTGHTVSLTGSLRWGQTGVDALQNLRTWATTVQVNSGYHPSTVIFDPKAADLFLRSPSVLLVMQTFRQTTGNVDLASFVVGGALGHEVRYLGSLGEFDFFVYQQLYADDTGAIQKFIPDYTVVMGNVNGVQGIRTYGAIQDFKAELMATTRFPKVWLADDPSVWFSMLQSAPLPLAGWIDASFAATVTDGL